MLQILCVHSCLQSYVAMSVERTHMRKFTGIFCNAPSSSPPPATTQLQAYYAVMRFLGNKGAHITTHPYTLHSTCTHATYNHYFADIPLGIVVVTTKANNVNVHIVAANLPITHAFNATRCLFVVDDGVIVAQLSVGTPISSVE